MELSLILSSIALGLVVINSFSMKVVKNKPNSITKSVSILVPMRNEESNVSGCVNSLLKQKGLKKSEILILNDHSTDKSAKELAKFKDIKVLSGKPLPDNWLGKLWACQQLADKSKGEYLVFVDADVRLSENAISASITAMEKWDFISAYPKQIAVGFLQRVFQPLLQWSWLASVPLVIAQRFRIRSMTVANGQFLIIKRSAYEAIGGHKSVKSEVLDDLMLARRLVISGFTGSVAEASQVASCQMYKTSGELIAGYRKSLWKAFGGVTGSIIAILLLLITGVLPFIAALLGSEIGVISFILIVISRVISSIRTGTLPNTSLLHPLAIIFLVSFIIYSWVGKISGTLTWRDRPVI